MARSANAVTRQADAGALAKWVTFGIGQEPYGIPVLQVQEVLKVPEIAAVPEAPGHVLGIINLHGNVVTMLDMRRRFHLDERPHDDATRIILVEMGESVGGILVDRVEVLIELGPHQFAPLPSSGHRNNANVLSGVAHIGEETLMPIDADKLLSPEDWQALDAG